MRQSVAFGKLRAFSRYAVGANRISHFITLCLYKQILCLNALFVSAPVRDLNKVIPMGAAGAAELCPVAVVFPEKLHSLRRHLNISVRHLCLWRVLIYAYVSAVKQVHAYVYPAVIPVYGRPFQPCYLASACASYQKKMYYHTPLYRLMLQSFQNSCYFTRLKIIGLWLALFWAGWL